MLNFLGIRSSINLNQGELQLILRIGIFDSMVVQMMLQEVVNHNVDEEKGSVLECFTILSQQLLQNSWPIKLGLNLPLLEPTTGIGIVF